MCDEGATLNECRFDIYGIIDRYGWFIQYVEVEPVTLAWAYTIGLAAGFDHPELVVTGVGPETAGNVLNAIGEMIRTGHRFDHDDFVLDPEGRCIRFSSVHPAHYDRGVFAVWDDYYDCLGPPYPTEAALEVLLPGQIPKLTSPISSIG